MNPDMTDRVNTLGNRQLWRTERTRLPICPLKGRGHIEQVNIRGEDELVDDDLHPAARDDPCPHEEQPPG